MGPADRRQRMGESSTATAEAFLKRTRHWRRVPVWGGSSSECTRFAGAVVCRNSHARGKRADLSPVRYSHQKSPALLTAAVPCNSAQPPPAKPRPVVPHQAGFLVSEPVQLGPVRDRASGYSGVVKEPFIASALWRGAALAEPNSPLLLELCFNTLDPRMPPMLGRRRNRDKMQETAIC